MKKQTAVEWLLYSLARNNIAAISVAESIENEHRIIEQAKEMEKEQRGYSKEDVIKIVEKSRETGLTAEYLLLTYKSE